MSNTRNLVDISSLVSGSSTALSIPSVNLTFGGTAQRITGDFSNATVANRLMFQTSTVNGATSLNTIPNGTSVNSGVNCFNAADPTNAGFGGFLIGGTEFQVRASITGTGTYLPMTFLTGGSERVRIDTSGNVGIGTASPAAYSKITIGGTWPTAANISYGTVSNGIIPSGATGAAVGYYTGMSTQASAFTCGAMYHYFAAQGTIGASSTLSNQYGFFADSGLVGATNNYGFFSNIASGTGRWNFYANGSADNYFAGPVQFGSTVTPASLNAASVGYNGTPLNEQSAAYTLVAGDMGKSIVHPASDNNARTFTIPANGTVAFPVGTTITFINMINTVTIAITTDTMYLAGAGTTGSRTLAAYGMATAVKLTSTTWIISGNGLT